MRPLLPILCVAAVAVSCTQAAAQCFRGEQAVVVPQQAVAWSPQLVAVGQPVSLRPTHANQFVLSRGRFVGNRFVRQAVVSPFVARPVAVSPFVTQGVVAQPVLLQPVNGFRRGVSINLPFAGIRLGF